MSIPEPLIQPDRGQDAIAIHLVNTASFDDFAKGLSGPQRATLAAQKFKGGGYETAIVPEGEGWFAVGGVANAEVARQTLGPDTVDGIAPRESWQAWWREQVQRKRTHAPWT